MINLKIDKKTQYSNFLSAIEDSPEKKEKKYKRDFGSRKVLDMSFENYRIEEDFDEKNRKNEVF